jgi:predicted dehydrogenase
VFTVVGGGFGLYGYVPALADLGETILIARRYEPAFLSRPELQRHAPAIRWVDDVDAGLRGATGVVLAVPPAEQPALARRCCELGSIRQVVLEKPIAVDPAGAQRLLDTLHAAGKRYRIGYTLLHTAWAERARMPADGASVEWHFMAHHFTRGLHNWKRTHATGGGVLRFFGVHVLAWLAREGVSQVIDAHLEGEAPGEPSRWTARVRHGGGDCAIEVDSRADAPHFGIRGSGQTLVSLPEPFAEEAAHAGEDRRVAVLKRLLASFGEDDAAWSDVYRRTNALWSDVERLARVA